MRAERKGAGTVEGIREADAVVPAENRAREGQGVKLAAAKAVSGERFSLLLLRV
jgi:hypothetical protein